MSTETQDIYNDEDGEYETVDNVRVEALNRACMSVPGTATTADIVKRAKEFEKFLRGSASGE